MKTIEPELLMRYADGEVSLPERRWIDERLPADPEGQALLASFQTQGVRLPAAFAMAERDDDLRRCEDVINAAFEQRRQQRRQADVRRWALPLAASLLITLSGGLFATYYADQRIQTETTRILAEQAARQTQEQALALETRINALERIISGNSLTWESETTGTTGTVTPLRTYQGPDGQWCREYRETTSTGSADNRQFSIACRTPDGLWRGHGMTLDPWRL